VVVWVVPLLPGSAIVPKSVVLQYMVTVLVGVLIYVSDNEERWRRFKEPIQAVLIEPRLKLVRAAVVAAVTALVGLVAYGQVKTTVAAPPNLRSIHPAPPAEITFRGRTITLTGLENPLRQHADSWYWYANQIRAPTLWHAAHAAGLVHRDFTLRNILVDEGANVAYVFDFDLAMSLDDLGTQTYRTYYKGRIFGSPGWSVAPETIDQALMDSSINTSLDIYAIGGALHGLFTDQLLYGPADDMWALLIRIAEGVVVGGKSKVFYPEGFPLVLKSVIEGCIERDPNQRFPSVQAVVQELRSSQRELPDDRPSRKTSRPAGQEKTKTNEVALPADPTITHELVEAAERAVFDWGYAVERSLGRVRGHPIFLAAPRVDMVESGQFPDANIFPKLVTVIDLTKVADPRQFVENWQQHFWPTLKRVRQGLLTSLHKVIYDANTSSLLLFSEYVDEPRFGERIAELDLNIDGALSLGFVVIRQVAALHEHGMAHNNISPNALLFKGAAATRMVMPAMIGLVEPAMGAEAMAGDCRQLAGMILTWLRPGRVAALHVRIKPMFDALRGRLSAWAFDKQVKAPAIDELMSLISDALSLVDFNFSVLRDSGGDLQEYGLLLISLRLYHLLWPSVPVAAARPTQPPAK